MRANLAPLVTGEFILFLNFLILKTSQNLHPKYKKRQIYTRKKSLFLGNPPKKKKKKKKSLVPQKKKKKKQKKHKKKFLFLGPPPKKKKKKNTTLGHLLLKIIEAKKKTHCFCRFILTNCSPPTETHVTIYKFSIS